eukprot:TRINITY_DN5571_c0_g1_i1.p1 TRINITY_DN5571_c0_g1~~TRINITY_DN5571_c0_g1_i1.p1  ORF type:complete len:561 (-),score=132.09 TRINITY_DN5571_c0_g1_i1:33-1715(-)
MASVASSPARPQSQAAHRVSSPAPVTRASTPHTPIPKTVSSRPYTRDTSNEVLPVLKSKSATQQEDQYKLFYAALTTLALAPQGNSLKTSAAAIESIETTLYNNPKIQCVNFFGCNLAHQVGETLGQLLTFKKQNQMPHNLQVIILDQNPKLGHKGTTPLLRSLREDSVVTTLHLETCGMGDIGAAELGELLRSNTKLTHINLASNEITDLGAASISAALASQPSLTFLGLSFNKIRDAGAEHLAKALEENSALLHLELVDCRLGDKGYISLGLALSTRNTTLQGLNLLHNQVSEEGLTAFGNLMDRNTAFTSLLFPVSDHISSQRLRDIIRRNKRVKQLDEPHQLEKEVARLYHQQHKLQVATQQLNQIVKVKNDLDGVVQREESEVALQKQEIQKRAKDIKQSINLVEQNIVELKQKQEDHVTNLAKEHERHKENLAMLAEKLEIDAQRAAKMEKEFEERQAELNRLTAAMEEKRRTLLQRIKTAQEEAARAFEEAKESRLKSAEAAQRVEELNLQVLEVQAARQKAAEAQNAQKSSKPSKAARKAAEEAALRAMLGD